MNNTHLPVLLKEAIQSLNIKPNGIYVDCTAGRGGHSEAILQKLGPNGRLICIDMDEDAITYLNEKFNDVRVTIIKNNYSNIKEILSSLNIETVDGILADIGVSSPQLDNIERGFSYHSDAKLDMRMDKSQDKSAYTVINEYTQSDLCKIFKTYGEILKPNSVAHAIVEERLIKPIVTTSQLVEIIKSNIDKKLLFQKKHPARKYFQAIRIEVNDELNNLEKFIDVAPSLLKSEGRLSIISFHSLEDRIIKTKFAEFTTSNIPKEIPIIDEHLNYKTLTKKPIEPSVDELEKNNRSRSAKLRTIIKI